jgi:6-phosphogluconolactonase
MERAVELTRHLDFMVKTKAKQLPDESFMLAISGGSSPLSLFELWSGIFRETILWENISLFWVDERAVPPNDPESNYGVAKRFLLDKIPLSPARIFRIEAEKDVREAALNYSNLISNILPVKDGFPIFDLVILGIGDDGHTASIFPGQTGLFSHSMAYAASVNPYTGQQRVTMTGKTIETAKNVMFYVRGESKQDILNRLRESDSNENLPASHFLKLFGDESLYYDKF